MATLTSPLLAPSRERRYAHTPLVTGADCEGAGEMFQVTRHLRLPLEGTLHLPRTHPRGRMVIARWLHLVYS